MPVSASHVAGLIYANADLKAPINKDGETLLISCLGWQPTPEQFSANAAIARSLLQVGADVNKATPKGCTPLIAAGLNGCCECILLQNKDHSFHRGILTRMPLLLPLLPRFPRSPLVFLRVL